MILDNETARDYHDTIRRHFNDRLTDWEDGFLQSIDLKLMQDRLLTENQSRTLDDLMTRFARSYR